jgi:hypothetical protein
VSLGRGSSSIKQHTEKVTKRERGAKIVNPLEYNVLGAAFLGFGDIILSLSAMLEGHLGAP